jgi:hypothetical protein
MMSNEEMNSWMRDLREGDDDDDDDVDSTITNGSFIRIGEQSDLWLVREIKYRKNSSAVDLQIVEVDSDITKRITVDHKKIRKVFS